MSAAGCVLFLGRDADPLWSALIFKLLPLCEGQISLSTQKSQHNQAYKACVSDA